VSRSNALSVSRFSVGYPRRPVIENLNLPALVPGHLTALIGPNGAGKTTLLRGLARLLAAKGEIRLGERDLLAIGQRDHAALVSYMPQALPKMVSLSVIEAVITALRAMPLEVEAQSKDQVFERAMAVLTRLGIGHLAYSMLDELSGGQRQLASLAQSVVRSPAILLLDEPTSALDPRHQINVMKSVRGIVTEAKMIAVVVLHDLNLALRWADTIVLMDQGRVVASGAPSDVVTPEHLAQTYGIAARVERCSHGQLIVLADDTFERPATISQNHK